MGKEGRGRGRKSGIGRKRTRRITLRVISFLIDDVASVNAGESSRFGRPALPKYYEIDIEVSKV